MRQVICDKCGKAIKNLTTAFFFKLEDNHIDITADICADCAKEIMTLVGVDVIEKKNGNWEYRFRSRECEECAVSIRDAVLNWKEKEC